MNKKIILSFSPLNYSISRQTNTFLQIQKNLPRISNYHKKFNYSSIKREIGTLIRGPFHPQSWLRMFYEHLHPFTLMTWLRTYIFLWFVYVHNFVCCLIITVHLTWKEIARNMLVHYTQKFDRKEVFLLKWLNEFQRIRTTV